MNVRVDGVSFAFERQPVLRKVDLQAKPKELLGIIGPNGSGKTTLLQLMSGALTPTQGAVYLDGEDLSKMPPSAIARRVAALEQEHEIAFGFLVREVVAWGRIPHQSRWRRWRETDAQAVEKALTLTDTLALAERPLQALSGGERQRVFVAMALAQDPQVLLMDEPTAHLDLKYQFEILSLAKRLAQRGLAVVVALHDLNLAARYADRLALLAQGNLVALGHPCEVLTEARIAQVWDIHAGVRRHAQGGLSVTPKVSSERKTSA